MTEKQPKNEHQKPLILITIVVILAAIASLYKAHSKPSPIKITESPSFPSSPTSQFSPKTLTKKPQQVLIQLSGEVPHPGLYNVTANQRVFEILAQTGGTLPTADLTKIKLAAKIKDGITITVPKLKSEPSKKSKKPNPAPKKQLSKKSSAPPSFSLDTQFEPYQTDRSTPY